MIDEILGAAVFAAMIYGFVWLARVDPHSDTLPRVLPRLKR